MDIFKKQTHEEVKAKLAKAKKELRAEFDNLDKETQETVKRTLKRMLRENND